MSRDLGRRFVDRDLSAKIRKATSSILNAIRVLALFLMRYRARIETQLFQLAEPTEPRLIIGDYLFILDVIAV